MPYYVYVLFSPSSKSFYKGQTNDLVQRLARHDQERETYTSKNRPWHLAWYTIKPTRTEAMALEKKLKNLSVNRLKLLIDKYPVEKRITGLDVFDPWDQ